MSASNIDPDIQAAFAGTSPTASSTTNVDPDIQAAFKDDGVQNTGRRVGWAEENLLGPSEVIGSAVANLPYSAAHAGVDLYRRLTGGDTNAPDPAAVRAIQVPQGAGGTQLISDIGKLPGIYQGVQGAKAADAALGRVSPTAQDVVHQTLGVAGDVANLAPPIMAARALTGSIADRAAARAASELEQGHPLTSAAQSEIDDMKQHAATASAAGVELPPRAVSPAQAYANNAARQDLNLPKNAPVTDGIIDAAQKQNVAPAYKAASKVPAYQLGPNYQDAIGKVNLDKIDPEWRPPTDGTMTGQQAVDSSKQLRSIARGLYQDADNYNLTSVQQNQARVAAQAHYQAAKAVEGGFREAVTAQDAAKTAAGTPTTAGADTADAWDQARVYNAKAETWRGALDGAGNVIAPKIKKLLNDEPITGPMKDVASVAAQYPELFRGTRLQTPTEGPVKRGVRAVAPMLGAAAGEAVLPGSLGSMAGAAGGEYAAQKFLGPQR